MSCACAQSSTAPFELTLPLGSAPSWPFTLEDDSDPLDVVALDLTGAALWFAVKTAPSDADADALIFASTANGKIVITSAADGEAQVNLTASDTAATDALAADCTYYAYLKVQLASGETRVRSGYVHTLPAGITAPE